MARDLSKEIIDTGYYELWTGVESVAGKTANDELYEHTSYFYLFNLEEGASNPAGLDKASNKEAIFRSVFDSEYRKSNMNLTHTEPAKMTRKLVDMYLCEDGLPPHLSPDFKGYQILNAELENRDYRLTACLRPFMEYRWGYGNTGANYSLDITELGSLYMVIPDLRNGGAGYLGRKFNTELARITSAGGEAADCYHIRLSEIYLTYAEAVCELGEGAISDADLDYSINKVRARGGIAPLSAALLSYAASRGGTLNYLDEIRRERAVELYAEGQRLSDLCRWGIAEQELGQARCGVYLTYNGQDTELIRLNSPVDNDPVYNASSYNGRINEEVINYYYSGLTPTRPGAAIIEAASNRQFALKNYLQPIPTDQIVLNPNLLQNPGW